MDQKDAATFLVLSSHLQLQKEGFLSTWTNSFVGPWDPSQGLHNPGKKWNQWLLSNYGLFYNVTWVGKGRRSWHNWHKLWLLLCNWCTDEKIKLWLFLPGRQSSVPESALATVSRLRGTICFWVFIVILYWFPLYVFIFFFWFGEINNWFYSKLDFSWTME